MARVLVIEDEKSIADALGRGLAAAGFAVDIATDGTDGWLNTDTQPYDLVLLDIIATNWIIWDTPFTPRFDLELAHRLQSAERPRRRDVSPAWRSRCCESPIAQHAGRGGRITMKRHRHTPEQVIRKLREGERLLADGKELTEVLRQLEISEATWNRWRSQYGGMKANGAKRLRELEVENGRLKTLLAEAELDKAMLKELAEGNF